MSRRPEVEVLVRAPTGNRKVVFDATRTMSANLVSLLALNLAGILIVRALGIGGRGDVAAAVLIPSVIGYACFLGIPVATGYFINSGRLPREKTIATARSMALLLSVVASLIGLGLILLLPRHDSVILASVVFILFIPINFLASINQAILQADMRFHAYNVVRILGSTVYLISVMCLYFVDEATLLTVVIAQLAGNLAFLVISYMFVGWRPWANLDTSTARSMLGFGGKAHLGSMSPVDNLRLDQLLLATLMSTYDLGLYVIAMAFVTANRLVGISMGSIAFSIASRRERSTSGSGRGILKVIVAATLILGSLLAAFEIILGRQLLRYIFDVHTTDAYRVLAILAVGSIFMNGRQVCSDILRGLGKPGIASLSELVSMGSLFGLIIAFWRWDLVGVSWAVTVSAGISFCSLLILGFVRLPAFLRLKVDHLHSRNRTLRRSFAILFGAIGCSVGVGIVIVVVPVAYVGLLATLVAMGCAALLISMRFGTRGLATAAIAFGALTVPMNAIRLSAGVALCDVLFLAAAATLLPHHLIGGRKGLRDIRLLVQGIMLIVVGGLIGSIFATDPGSSITRLIKFTVAATLIPLVLSAWAPTIVEIKRIAWISVTGAMLSAVVAVTEMGQFNQGRADGLTLHPNHLGLASVMAIGPAIALTLLSRGNLRLYGAFCCMALGTGILISGSRAAVLGCLVAVLVMVVTTRRWEIWGGIGLAGLSASILVLGSIVALPAGNAFSRLFGSQDASVSGAVAESNLARELAFHEAAERAISHPLTGVGFADALSAHNIYLQLWSSAGILGLAGFALVLFATLGGAVRLFRSRTGPVIDSVDLLLLGFTAGFIGYIATGPFHNLLWDRFIWFAPSIVAVVLPYSLKQMSNAADRCAPKSKSDVRMPIPNSATKRPLSAVVSFSAPTQGEQH